MIRLLATDRSTSRLARRAATLRSLAPALLALAAAMPGGLAIAGPAWKAAPVTVTGEDEGSLGLPLETGLEGPLGDVVEFALFVLNDYYGYVALVVVVFFLVFHPRTRRDSVAEAEVGEQPLRPS